MSDQTSAQPMTRSNLGARLLTAAIGAPLLLLLLFKGSPEAWYFLVLLATGLATYELTAMTHVDDRVGQGVCAAISMLVTIENSFNTIYRAPEGRPWARRVPLYWFLLTVSPIALSLTAVLHTWVETWADDLGWGPLFAGLVTIAWSIIPSS